MTAAPLVGLSACSRSSVALPFQWAGLKYIEAIVHGAAATPLLIPALGEALDIPALVARLDGVFLTGSPSNVDPGRYDAERQFDQALLDPARDATTFALIVAALEQGVPLFAVCRGFQELNVALGGSLHQQVQGLPGMADHREHKDAPVDRQYAPAHRVTLVEGGSLQTWLDGRREIRVNSLHAQGIDRLATRLEAEAHADDGLIEAVRVRDARSFALGVQWHPEWKVLANPDALPLFRAFGAACRARMLARTVPS